MAMSPRDWQDLASVFRAGAEHSRGWGWNSDRQQDAEILDAQADRCDEIARERNGNPAVVHEHPHMHTGPDGRQLRHQHKHSHGRGRADHELDPVGHKHGEHGPGRDPFAPLPSLFPKETGPE